MMCVCQQDFYLTSRREVVLDAWTPSTGQGSTQSCLPVWAVPLDKGELAVSEWTGPRFASTFGAFPVAGWLGLGAFGAVVVMRDARSRAGGSGVR